MLSEVQSHDLRLANPDHLCALTVWSESEETCEDNLPSYQVLFRIRPPCRISPVYIPIPPLALLIVLPVCKAIVSWEDLIEHCHSDAGGHKMVCTIAPHRLLPNEPNDVWNLHIEYGIGRFVAEADVAEYLVHNALRASQNAPMGPRGALLLTISRAKPF